MGSVSCCEKDQQPAPVISTVRIKARTSDKEVFRKKIGQQKLRQQQQQQSKKKQQKGIGKHGPENYQSLKYLGRGTFGDVVLAQDKQTCKQYAMKIIDKSKIQQVNVMQYKTIKQISHRNILVNIRQTFQNENKIYIIMQYLNKGDIYFYLKKKQVKFDEQVIQNLIAEIIYGVEILHSYGIIYRELKPENILVTNDGHIKLTDYGLSKMLVQNRTFTCTFVGALQYMAPEALKGNYGKQIDIWSIGILIFQLIFERNPFSSPLERTQSAIQQKIQTVSIEQVLNQNIGKISQQLRDLLIGLLQKQPSKRMTIEQIKNHIFFKNINWEDVRQRKNKPPLKQYIEKNDHIRFRDPTNDTELPHRPVKYTAPLSEKQGYSFNIVQFRSSN